MLEQVTTYGERWGTAPTQEAKASDPVDEEGRRATNRQQQERMLIEAALPEAPDIGEHDTRGQPPCSREVADTGESTRN